MKEQFLMTRNGKTYLISEPKITLYGTARESLRWSLLKRILKKEDKFIKLYYKSIHKDLKKLRDNVLAEQPKIDYLNEKIAYMNELDYGKWKAEIHDIKNAINVAEVNGEDFSDYEKKLEELESKRPTRQKEEYVELSKTISRLKSLGPYKIVDTYLNVIDYDKENRSEAIEIATQLVNDYDLFKKHYRIDTDKVINLVWNDEELFFSVLNESFGSVEQCNIKTF